MTLGQGVETREDIEDVCKYAFDAYERMLERGVAKEIARMVLPTNLYTEWYWKCDLRNIFHFLTLRLDPHAQWEIRQYAEGMEWYVQERFPRSWEAWSTNDHMRSL